MKNLFLRTLLFLCVIFINTIFQPQQGKSESVSQGETSSKKLYQLTIPEIDSLIQDISRTHYTTNEKIILYSRLALGTPYVQGSLGEGPKGLYDQDPLVDFSRVDCMTFCEQTLALAISKNYNDTVNNLQKIRYHNGRIAFTTRNHFVIADWLPNNRWLLKNITEEKGGGLCKDMVKTIDRRRFAESFGCNDTNHFPPPQRIHITYLPKPHLLTIPGKLKGGEIMILITSRDDVFACHMGFIIKQKDGSLLFRHASLTHKQVIDEPYDQLDNRLQHEQSIAGAVFLDVGSDL